MQRLMTGLLLMALGACGGFDEASNAPVPVQLDGTQWTVAEYLAEEGGLVGVLDGTQVTLIFGDDARVTGSAGCNSYSASYAVDTDGLRVGLPAATRMFCGEQDGLMDQEFRFLFLLEKAAGVRRQEETLSLVDESGEPLLVLRPMA